VLIVGVAALVIFRFAWKPILMAFVLIGITWVSVDSCRAFGLNIKCKGWRRRHLALMKVP
jgi:hypothetical protein